MQLSNALLIAATIIGVANAAPVKSGCTKPTAVGLGRGFDLKPRDDSCHGNPDKYSLDTNHRTSLIDDFMWHWTHGNNEDTSQSGCIAHEKGWWMAWVELTFSESGWDLKKLKEKDTDKAIITNFISKRKDSGEPKFFSMDLTKDGKVIGKVKFDGYDKASKLDLSGRCTKVKGSS